MLEAGIAEMKDLQGYICPSYDPRTATLSFGCNPVYTFSLGVANATQLTAPITIDTTVPKLKLGGTISIGGVITF